MCDHSGSPLTYLTYMKEYDALFLTDYISVIILSSKEL